MASFFENLWNSIFTPGPTPTLLVATNVTFAALQLVLGALLATTRSVHFVVLSTLCAGLWWAINWFAEELRKAERAEEEASRLRKRKSGIMAEQRDREPDTTDYTAEDSTETETEVEGGVKRVQVWGGPEKAKAVLESAAAARDDSPSVGGVRIRGGPQKILGVMESAAAADAEREASASTGIEIRGGPEKIAAILGLNEETAEGKNSDGSSKSKKPASVGEGSVSTDSEWEKVSDR